MTGDPSNGEKRSSESASLETPLRPAGSYKTTHDPMPSPIYSSQSFANYSTTDEDDTKTYHYSRFNLYKVEGAQDSIAIIYREYKYSDSPLQKGKPEIEYEALWGEYPRAEAIRKAEISRVFIDQEVRKGGVGYKDPALERVLRRDYRKVYESNPYGEKVENQKDGVRRHTYRQVSVERVGGEYCVFERTHEYAERIFSDGRKRHIERSKDRVTENKELSRFESARSAISSAASYIERVGHERGEEAKSTKKEREYKDVKMWVRDGRFPERILSDFDAGKVSYAILQADLRSRGLVETKEEPVTGERGREEKSSGRDNEKKSTFER